MGQPCLSSPIGRKMHGRSAGLFGAISNLLAKELSDEPDAVLKLTRVVSVHPAGVKDVVTAPKIRWAPHKSVLSASLLEAFCDAKTKLLPDGSPIEISASISVDGRGTHIVSKLVAKRAGEWVMEAHGDRIRASGELSEEQLSSPKRMNKILARAAFDALMYLYASALDTQDDGDDARCLLKLHTTKERLVGPASRGCGIVYCERGESLFKKACAEAGELVKPPPAAA